MKRKVIQIANSTQLISLPRKWSQKYGVKKGDELDVEENGNKIIINTSRSFQVNNVEFDIDNLEPMVLRTIVALYKEGVDEIKVTFSKHELLDSIQKSIGKEAVGYEITEQGKNYCIIKHVSGELEDFDPVLRRTFLVLISMANESLESIKKNQLDNLKNVAFLEEANNRFTTTCRRFLNKRGYQDSEKVGPLYYIIEEIENIADEYKYLCNHVYNLRNKKPKINNELIELYQQTNDMLKIFYELYYKFEKEKLVWLGNRRKFLVDRFLQLFEKNSSDYDKLILHHLFVITQKIFCLVGPYLTINL